MGLFKSRRKDILDLTKKYKEQQAKVAEIKEELNEGSNSQESSQTQSSGGVFNFFESMSNAGKTNSETSSNEGNEYVDVTGQQDRRRKLAKRLMDITNKLEELSNQIYKLQQRIEVVEKKVDVGNY